MAWHIDYNAAVSFSLLKSKYRRFLLSTAQFITFSHICTYLIKVGNMCKLSKISDGIYEKQTYLLIKQNAPILNFVL